MPPAARPVRTESGGVGLYLKHILVKLVSYMEICALPYIAGIGAAVGLAWTLPEGLWSVVSRLGVLGAVAVLYSPIVILHAAFILHLKKRFPAKSALYFLEDSLFEHRLTTALALFAGIVSFFWGIVNYNFAVDIAHPQHVSKFVAKPWESNQVSLSGKIIREPEFRDYNVWLFIQPHEINRKPVAKGLVLVKVARTVEDFEEFKYGQYVEAKGHLREPEPAMNPETFDYKKFLNNRNVFGLLNVSKAENIKDLGRRESNPLFDVSLWVKKEFLTTMKQTLPFPQSALQGGIIYGLKTGIPYEEHFKFKWAGMAWVLVVAGAHLLMVYLTLKMILETFRPNPKLAFCILFVLLIIFTILTGVSPPTVRAFIMIMLYEVTKVFLGQDIRATIRSAIGIAAFLMLSSHVFPYFSPLLIFEPTVTLSYCAVLSLIYLSRPIEHVLRRYSYGLASVVILLGVTSSLVLMSVLRPPTLSLLGWQQLPVWTVTFILAFFAIRFNNRYREKYHLEHIDLGYNDPSRFRGWMRWIHPTFLTYNNLPKWVLGFVGAQIAIQFGMVLPLSSLYFQRSPVGGVIANIFAFPALGVVIQVGLVAVLVGMIPVIGLPLAFILNAADYLGIQFLRMLAHYSEVFFPYPMAMKPDGSQILLYYGALLAFIFFDRLFYSFDKHGYLTLREFLEEKLLMTKRPIYAKWLACANTKPKEWAWIGACVLVFGMTAFSMAQGLHLDHLRVIVMELDEGSGTIIQTPGGKRFLVDAGKVDWRGTFDIGERTIAPVLLGQQIEHLDGVFITTLRPENIGGIPFILENFTIGALYVPFDRSILTSAGDFTESDYERLGGRVRRGGDRQVVKAIDMIREAVRKRNIPVVQLADGKTVLKGGDLRMDVLNPPPADAGSSSPSNPAAGGLVLRITYGKSSILLGGDINMEEEAALLQRYPDLRSQFLLIPSHGAEPASGEAFVNAVKPDYVAVQYRRPPAWMRAGETDEPIERVLKLYTDAGAAAFRTDMHGAITIDAWADGRFEVTPILKTVLAAPSEGAEEESDTDLMDRALLKSEGTGL